MEKAKETKDYIKALLGDYLNDRQGIIEKNLHSEVERLDKLKLRDSFVDEIHAHYLAEYAKLQPFSEEAVIETIDKLEPTDCYAACQFAGNDNCSRTGKLLCYADIDKVAKAIMSLRTDEQPVSVESE